MTQKVGQPTLNQNKYEVKAFQRYKTSILEREEINSNNIGILE